MGENWTITNPAVVTAFLCWFDGEESNQRVVEAVGPKSAAEVYMKERHARDLGDTVMDDDVYVVCVSAAQGDVDVGPASWSAPTRWTVRASMQFSAWPK